MRYVRSGSGHWLTTAAFVAALYGMGDLSAQCDGERFGPARDGFRQYDDEPLVWRPRGGHGYVGDGDV